MLFNAKLGTKEAIISLLAGGPVSSPEVQRKISKNRNISKQGFYKILRELIKSQIVLKNKQLLLLNNGWIHELTNFIKTIDRKAFENGQSFIHLEDDESLTYHFKTMEGLDVFWMHWFLLLVKEQKNAPVIFYGMHEYFVLSDPYGTSTTYSLIQENKLLAYLVIGSNTALDRETTKHVRNFGVEVAYETKPSFNKNYFTTVIGDYILDTVLDVNTTTAIDNLYITYPVLNKAVAVKLEDILSQIKRCKIIVRRNKKRSELIRKKLMKYFVFYK